MRESIGRECLIRGEILVPRVSDRASSFNSWKKSQFSMNFSAWRFQPKPTDHVFLKRLFVPNTEVPSLR
ncbi:MAG: hypothetical protein ACLU4N_00865 [Butyricimonas faecihominis]